MWKNRARARVALCLRKRFSALGSGVASPGSELARAALYDMERRSGWPWRAPGRTAIFGGMVMALFRVWTRQQWNRHKCQTWSCRKAGRTSARRLVLPTLPYARKRCNFRRTTAGSLSRLMQHCARCRNAERLDIYRQQYRKPLTRKRCCWTRGSIRGRSDRRLLCRQQPAICS